MFDQMGMKRNYPVFGGFSCSRVEANDVKFLFDINVAGRELGDFVNTGAGIGAEIQSSPPIEAPGRHARTSSQFSFTQGYFDGAIV